MLGYLPDGREKDSGTLVAATSQDWKELTIQRAPLNADCVTSTDPGTACQNSTQQEPSGWTSATFDDSSWSNATVYSTERVDPKLGYFDIAWDPSAALIWGPDLKVDNVILWRATVKGPA